METPQNAADSRWHEARIEGDKPPARSPAMNRSTRLNRLSLSLSSVVALASLASLGAAGCAASTGAPEADEQEVASIEAALARDNGGFTTADERPDFGDDEVS
jgi:hypothetical protein